MSNRTIPMTKTGCHRSTTEETTMKTVTQPKKTTVRGGKPTSGREAAKKGSRPGETERSPKTVTSSSIFSHGRELLALQCDSAGVYFRLVEPVEYLNQRNKSAGPVDHGFDGTNAKKIWDMQASLAYESMFCYDWQAIHQFQTYKDDNGNSIFTDFRGKVDASELVVKLVRDKNRETPSPPEELAVELRRVYQGEGVGDLFALVKNLKFIRDQFLKEFGFDPAGRVGLRYSGGRSAYLRFPEELFGGWEPSELLPAQHLELAYRLIPVVFDYSIFNHGQLVRFPGSMHRTTNLLDVDIPWDLVANQRTPEVVDYLISKAVNPRWFDRVPPVSPVAVPSLVALWQAMVAAVKDNSAIYDSEAG